MQYGAPEITFSFLQRRNKAPLKWRLKEDKTARQGRARLLERDAPCLEAGSFHAADNSSRSSILIVRSAPSRVTIFVLQIIKNPFCRRRFSSGRESARRRRIVRWSSREFVPPYTGPLISGPPYTAPGIKLVPFKSGLVARVPAAEVVLQKIDGISTAEVVRLGLQTPLHC